MSQSLNMIILDKNVPIPLYYQLKKQVLGLIECAALKSGDMLPPESDLCETLKVSRPTIRQAFKELVDEGYLTRFKGKGTFVATLKVKDQFLSRLESFNQEMTQKGMTPHTTVLALEKLPGNPECNERLGISYDAPIIHLSRLRAADDVMMVFVDTYLAYDRFPRLMEVDFTSVSLYDALEELYNARIHSAHREIESVNARRREAELLQVSLNKALSLVKTTSYTVDSPKPVEYSVARYRGDLTKFSVDIYR